MKTELHKCDVCGKTAKLESGKRHWCDCNPHAPFYMVSVRLRKMTDQLVGGFLAARNARRHNAPGERPAGNAHPTTPKTL